MKGVQNVHKRCGVEPRGEASQYKTLLSIPRSFSHDFITAVMWVYQKFLCETELFSHVTTLPIVFPT